MKEKPRRAKERPRRAKEKLARRAEPRPRPSRKKKAVPRARASSVRAVPATDLEALRTQLEQGVARASVARWNADPDDVQRSVVRLVLALVEFLRKLMERQAVRRMEGGTLDPDEVERVGTALMKLEETVHDLARRFHIPPEELNLDLGPLGKLM